MSIYDKAMNAMFAGEVIHMPAQTNIVSLRRHYNRTCAQLRQDGIAMAKLLHIEAIAGGYRMYLAEKKSLDFVVENPNEDT